MCCRKSTWLFCVAALSLWGCARATASKPTVTPAPGAPVFEPIDLPDAISSETRELFETQLHLLPLAHPDRIALRDRIVASIAEEFNRCKADDLKGRLALFDEALALHEAGDFAPGRVSEPAVPMVRWILEQFEPRGDEAIVLAALRFLMFSDPEPSALRERYRNLADWSVSVRETIPDPLERTSSLIDVYLEMARRVPDREVVERLAELYVARHRMIAQEFAQRGAGLFSPQDLMMRGRLVKYLPVYVIYIFFRLGDPVEARKYLADLAVEGTVNERFIDLLDAIGQGNDQAESYLELAGYLGEVDYGADLEACLMARAADRSDPRGSLCVGYALDKMGRLESGADFYLESAEVAPEEAVFVHVMQLLQAVLYRLHEKERTAATERLMKKAAVLVARVLERDPPKESEVRLHAASLLCTMGEIEFDNGRIATAREQLTRSYEVLPNVRAVAKLAEVHYLLGEFDQGIAVLDLAAQGESSQASPSDFWQAVLMERRADLLDSGGRSVEARESYQAALGLWNQVEITPEQAPIVAFRRGVVLHRLGDVEGSRESFRLAIRLDPDRQGTYTQLISFLVIEERFEDAREFYELAYNQDQIETMWKIYYSLWIEGLSRRMGRGSFDLAMGYLETSDGESWQDKLAAYFAGKLAEKALEQSAANLGQKVEYEYYTAVLELTSGKKDAARTRLDKVIRSNLLGFFEYRMAQAILQREFTSKN